MKKRFIALFVLAFIFSFNLSVMADEGHSEEKATHSKEADMHSESKDAHSDAANAHSDAAIVHGEEKDSHGEEAGTHSEEEAHDGEAEDGHHGPIEETPPNYKVLGTYGAVNLSFILIGVWNKWFRRKEIK